MAITRQGGAGMLLPSNYGANNPLTNAQVNVPTGNFNLAPAESVLIPAGQWYVDPGLYSALQVFDPILQTWMQMATPPNELKLVTSDGVNVRLANQSGCAVGAIVTNVGSGYSNGFNTVTVTNATNSGNAQWRTVVGGAITGGTITPTTAGAGYTYVPRVWISPPPAGGVPATAICTLSSGVPSVVVQNQGAGYTIAPTITVVPDPRDPGPTTTWQGVTTLTGSGQLTAVIATNHGTTPVTALPTLTFAGATGFLSGSSAAATVIMNWALTGFTVTTAGSGWGSGPTAFTASAANPYNASTPGAIVNPQISTGLYTPRPGLLVGSATAGALTATGASVVDGGAVQAVPQLALASAGPTAALVGVLAATVGGLTDQVGLYPY
jgi:hypothetical protein